MGLDPITKFIIRIAIAAFSYMQQRKAQKKAERQARAARSNVLVNKQSNNDPIYPLYGRQRMGGTRVFIEASDGAGNIQQITVPDPAEPDKTEVTNTTHLNMVLAMCEGEVDTIEELWFNDTKVWETADGGTITANSSGGYDLGGFKSGTKFSNTSYTMSWYPGTTTQTVDTRMQTSVGSGVWPSTARLRGISYLAMVLNASADWGGNLPTFTAVLAGKRILDVSTLVTGDTDSSLNSGNYTVGADQNPADVLYDLLISREFGKGLDRDENEDYQAGLHINLASFQQARIDCAASRGGSGYKINGFLQTEKQIFDNVGEILETCNGIILFKNGLYELHIKKKDQQLSLPDSKIFTRDKIIGEINFGMQDKSQKLNKVTGVFNNPVTKYNDDMVVVKSDAYITEDNGSVLEAQEDYTMITEEAIVSDLITQMMDISRQEQSVKMEVSHNGLLLTSGDIIEIRHPDFGWGTGAGETQKFWRVQELKLSEENTVEVTCTTYNSALEL